MRRKERAALATCPTVQARLMHLSSADNLAELRSAAERTTDWRFHCWYWGDAIAIDGLMEAHAWAPAGGGYREHVVGSLPALGEPLPAEFR